MAAIVIGNDTSVHETVAARAAGGAGGGTLKVEPDGYVIAGGDTLHAIALDADVTTWAITILGLVSSESGSGSVGVQLSNSGKSVSKLAVGETGSVFSADIGIDSTPALSLTSAGIIESAAQAVIARAAGSSVLNGGLIVNDGQSHLIEMMGAGLNTIKNTGTLAAGEGGGPGNAIHSGNVLSNDAVTNTGAIYGAIELGDGKNTLANSGEIQGSISTGAGDDKITNSNSKFSKAVIGGTITTGAGKDAVTNAGEAGGEVDMGDGDDMLANTGTVAFSVMLGSGNNTLTNSGTISGSGGSGVSGGEGNDKVTNSGHIYHGVLLGDGANVVANSGWIGGSLTLGQHNDAVTNTGTIDGSIILGEGTNKLTMSKGSAADVFGGSGSDAVTIGGNVTGMVDLGDGDDTITFTATGRAGGVTLGAGKDTYTGNGESEIVTDSDGSDTIRLGAGDDQFQAVLGTTPGQDGADTIDGGLGQGDLYDALQSTSAVVVNLGTVDFKHASSGLVPIAKSKATGQEVGTDTILNFEQAQGGGGDDTIIGSAAANHLMGGAGADHVFGLAGNDTIGGGAGADRLYGGAGADLLFGGEGGGSPDGAADVFVFETIAESTVSPKGRDTVMDFEVGFDRIDLSAIDANTKAGNADDQAFAWLGHNGKFTGSGGELRYFHVGTSLTVLYGDINGDKKADFAVGFKGMLELTDADFIL